MTTNSYDLLIQKLDAFIKKYYKNILIKGLLYFVTLFLLLYLAIIILEYYGHYNSWIRAGLFYTLLVVSGYLVIKFIVIPLSKLYKIGNTLSHKEASKIIGTFFPTVKDKLINTLELKAKEKEFSDFSLLEAAIQQKTSELNPVPFLMAIDLRKNVKYVRLALVPFFIYLIIYLIAPGMITDGTLRVLKYNQTFVVPPPFTFTILNKSLATEQFSDFELSVELSGREIPNEVYVNRGGNLFKMVRAGSNQFVYTFNSVNDKTNFTLDAAGFSSREYELEIISKPQMVKYSAQLIYPTYIKKHNETISNPGDLTLPTGTVIKWTFLTKKTDHVELAFNRIKSDAQQQERDVYTFTKKVFFSSVFRLKSENKEGLLKDSMQYQLNVIPDAFPGITVDEKTDSVDLKQRYFIGDINDDYGLTKLVFHYRFIKSDSPEKIKKGIQSQPIPINNGDKSMRFYHQIYLDDIGISPADEIEYYFEVWDNDGVQGSKSTKSKLLVYRASSIKELEKESEKNSADIKEKMEEAITEAKSLQKELKSLERKMLDKKELTWEEKKKLESLVNRQKELQTKIDQIKEDENKLSKQEQSFQKQNEEIIKKQQQIDKMFNEIMSDEMKKLIKQLEQMMQMQNKDQIKQEMDKLELNNKDVEKELDKMLEQFKQLELEKKMEDALDKLEKLADKQKDLQEKSEQLSKEKLTNDKKQEQLKEIQKEQEKVSEEFKDVEKKLDEIDKKNKELEEPKKLDLNKEEQKEIEDKQKQSEEDLKDNKPEKAAKEQKEAKDKMKEMGEKMKSEMESEQEKENEMNAEALREILENTIQLSNDQEKLMQDFKQVSNYNPQYVAMAKEQKTIRDNAAIIEDSLLALSKKVPEISTFINKEVSKLNDNLDKSIEGFGNRNIGQIRQTQQQAMMNANNLGVMLSEVLKQMQDNPKGNSEGKSGGKPKSGKGKGKGKGKSMGSMKKMQEELNKQLREGMNKQSGKGDKPGSTPGLGSSDYAKMAAQQMAIRQQMQKMLSEMGSKEKEELGGNGKLQELQRLMEQTEKELFNKRLSNEMIQRQEEILTRMLESEKAEKKQEQDKKREAEQAKEKPRTNPPSFSNYLNQKKQEQEMLQTIPAEMQPYYKEKTKEYLNKTGK